MSEPVKPVNGHLPTVSLTAQDKLSRFERDLVGAAGRNPHDFVALSLPASGMGQSKHASGATILTLQVVVPPGVVKGFDKPPSVLLGPNGEQGIDAGALGIAIPPAVRLIFERAGLTDSFLASADARIRDGLQVPLATIKASVRGATEGTTIDPETRQSVLAALVNVSNQKN